MPKRKKQIDYSAGQADPLSVWCYLRAATWAPGGGPAARGGSWRHEFAFQLGHLLTLDYFSSQSLVFLLKLESSSLSPSSFSSNITIATKWGRWCIRTSLANGWIHVSNILIPLLGVGDKSQVEKSQKVSGRRELLTRILYDRKVLLREGRTVIVPLLSVFECRVSALGLQICW